MAALGATQTTKQQVFTTVNPLYSAQYSVDRSTSSPQLTVTLSLNNLDTSGWTTTAGAQGAWVAIGYGRLAMAAGDITICRYNYKNSATDAFVCFDGWIAANYSVMTTETQDITNVKTNVNSISSTTKLGNFSVSFTKPFKSTDGTDQDQVLTN